MPDWPGQPAGVTPLHISSISLQGIGWDAGGLAVGGPASGTWVANLAVYSPFQLAFPYTVARVWWMNGSTASSNVDMGVYSGDGTLIYSTGSTAQSGASSVQYVAPAAPFVLSPGGYYIGWTVSGTTSRAYFQTITAAQGEAIGLIQQSTALPLPATITAAAFAGQGIPFCGITRTASGF